MVADTSIGTPEQLRDPDYTPALHKAVPLGIQHVLAMFVSNVTPAIIVAGAAGFGFGSNSPDFPELIYLIQMSMVFAGIATLLQTIGMGPVDHDKIRGVFERRSCRCTMIRFWWL